MVKRDWQSVAFIILIFCIFVGMAKAKEGYKYICNEAIRPISVDGKLDELSWKKAEAAELRFWNDMPAKLKTTVKLLWDNDYLYIAFVCEDTDIWTTMTKHDEPLYNENVVEVFINATGDQKSYIELEVNPQNAVFDARFDDKNKLGTKEAVEWKCEGLLTAVQIRGTLDDRKDKDENWIVEMAIPLSQIDPKISVPPKDGDRWKINLYRIEREPDQFYAWLPTNTPRPNFHVLDKFGDLVFSTIPVELKK